MISWNVICVICLVPALTIFISAGLIFIIREISVDL